MSGELNAVAREGEVLSTERGYVASIDQGTSSSRCIVFDRTGEIKSQHQMEHEQFYPEPGRVEHDAEEIWVRVHTINININIIDECAGISIFQIQNFEF